MAPTRKYPFLLIELRKEWRRYDEGVGDGSSTRHSARGKSFDRRSDAQHWAREGEAEADRSGWVVDTRLAEKTTLGELPTRYREELTPTKRSAVSECAIIRPPIRSPYISKLTSSDLASYRDGRLKSVVRELPPYHPRWMRATCEWGI